MLITLMVVVASSDASQGRFPKSMVVSVVELFMELSRCKVSCGWLRESDDK